MLGIKVLTELRKKKRSLTTSSISLGLKDTLERRFVTSVDVSSICKRKQRSQQEVTTELCDLCGNKNRLVVIRNLFLKVLPCQQVA